MDYFSVEGLIPNGSCAKIIIKGGPGSDLFESGWILEPMLIDLERGVAKVRHWPWLDRFHLTLIERVYGGGRNDLIIGNEAANTLVARSGRDEVHGRGGDDWLDGDEGPDQLYGDDGNDVLQGGTDNDFLDGATAGTTASAVRRA